jgi:hypothetical protein
MKRLCGAACLLILLARPGGAYSVLTHEAVIDAVWESHIRPLLLKKFPGATPEDLKRAHAFVYGGCLTQDMGYVPFSSKTFSDFAHYVRTGDFVLYLIRDAQNIEEYAFALGALAHYVSDHVGHPTVNRATAAIYPKDRKKFGNVVTYEDSPTDHLKTEFSFDVIEVARGRYAPDAYHDFIGFEVSKPALERAFQDTYGIPINDVFATLDLGIGTYRFSVGKLVPEMTKAAWQSKRSDIEKLAPGVTRNKFVYRLSRRDYEKEWDRQYKQPGFFARFLACMFRVIPKFGPFRALAFRPVPPAVEQEFLKSLDETIAQYRVRLNEVRDGRLKLPDINLDTGKPTRPGEYRLADKAYATLLNHLAEHHFANVTPGLRQNIVAFFSQMDRTKLSEKTIQHLEELNVAHASACCGEL